MEKKKIIKELIIILGIIIFFINKFDKDKITEEAIKTIK